MALCLMLLAFARWWSANQLPLGVDQDAATAFFETVGRYPRLAFRLLGVLGLLVAAAMFVTGPGGRVHRSVTSAWRSAIERWPGIDRLVTSSNEHLLALAIGLGVTGCLVVLVVDPLSARLATAVLVILAAGSGALWLVRAAKGEPAVAETSPAALPEVPRAHAATDEARAALVALAAELSADDVRVVRRLAVVLRDSR